MYFKHITLKNIGPIKSIDYDFPFSADGNPKPTILVGTNGSGKSIFLSHLLNPLMTAQQIAFDDAEVENGKVYKLRNPQYIKQGSTFSYARVNFGPNFSCYEWQLSTSREQHIEQFGDPGIDGSFGEIPLSETSLFKINYAAMPEEVSEQFRTNCTLYFPANRFEQPAWLNEYNLNAKAEFVESPKMKRFSNRFIIQQSPLASSKNWLLDIALDVAHYEAKNTYVNINAPLKILDGSKYKTIPPLQNTTYFIPILRGYEGRATTIWNLISRFIKLILRTDKDIRFAIGPRQNRSVSVMMENEQLIPNIFQLSTGQTLLLNIVLSILRDFDMSGADFEKIEDVTGVVIIDEVDIHLHADLQCNLLPEIISMFPKVQFVLTTHSPLFLLGMKNRFGEAGFDIFSVPTGRKIDVEEFEEFQSAFEFYKDSDIFRRKIESEVSAAQNPAIFVEGDFDIKYLRRAAVFLSKESILEKVDLYDGEGFGNLDKIWTHFKNVGRFPIALPGVVGLIYDCDVNRDNKDLGKVKKRGIPSIPGKSISKGIENLIPESRISELRISNPEFFDVTPAIEKTVRGNPEVQPEIVEINKSEKGNLCDWLCCHGTAEDFAQFESVFTIIEEIIGLN
jgi:AAA domain, putative AbiEii toxin, Type IV TA system